MNIKITFDGNHPQIKNEYVLDGVQDAVFFELEKKGTDQRILIEYASINRLIDGLDCLGKMVGVRPGT